jgi:hypothetical protein
MLLPLPLPSLPPEADSVAIESPKADYRPRKRFHKAHSLSQSEGWDAILRTHRFNPQR